MVSQWVGGIKPVPIERCVDIERVTEGAVTRRDGARAAGYGPPSDAATQVLGSPMLDGRPARQLVRRGSRAA